ncbi:unnamed protein product [Prorocentrum cordatum]|uniref:Beta-galactosidase trimerisation domain-containing protein n=1 Tax=Prorocentrum cordatum TaxID=2364126 RepID=A0ABN9UHX9_9DINO|nr:unnamed protein product [Polarella glacialis]
MADLRNTSQRLFVQSGKFVGHAEIQAAPRDFVAFAGWIDRCSQTLEERAEDSQRAQDELDLKAKTSWDHWRTEALAAPARAARRFSRLKAKWQPTAMEISPGISSSDSVSRWPKLTGLRISRPCANHALAALCAENGLPAGSIFNDVFLFDDFAQRNPGNDLASHVDDGTVSAHGPQTEAIQTLERAAQAPDSGGHRPCGFQRVEVVSARQAADAPASFFDNVHGGGAQFLEALKFAHPSADRRIGQASWRADREAKGALDLRPQASAAEWQQLQRSIECLDRAAHLAELCYGILDHATPRGSGRKFQEAKAFYASAREHASLWLAPLQARVALLYHTDSIFSWQAQPQSTAFDFTTEAHRMYFPFWRNGAAVDVVQMTRALAEAPSGAEMLARYRVLLLPAPMLLPDAALPVLEDFVRLGGSVWVGFRSDLKDARGQIRRQPSRLASLAGVAVDEFESLNDPLSAALNGSGGLATATAKVWREGLSVVDVLHEGPTEALWRYTDDFFGALGLAAATRRKPPGGGEVVYLGAGIEPEALVSVAAATLRSQSVQHAGAGPHPEVEQLIRLDLEGRRWRIRINHGALWRNGTGGAQVGPYSIHVAPADEGGEAASVGSPEPVQV